MSTGAWIIVGWIGGSITAAYLFHLWRRATEAQARHHELDLARRRADMLEALSRALDAEQAVLEDDANDPTDYGSG